MKLLLFALLLFPLSAFAARVISDPVDPRVSHCGVLLDVQEKLIVPVHVKSNGQKICLYRLGLVGIGGHMISMTAIWTDPMLGPLESEESIPLFFTCETKRCR